MGERCTGDCCRSFYLPYTSDDLRRAFAAWLASKPVFEDASGVERSLPAEVWLLAPMARSLGVYAVNPTSGAKLDQPHELFTCAHFNPENGHCGIYEMRPTMCREYPYGKQCEYDGCTHDEAREGKHGSSLVQLPKPQPEPEKPTNTDDPVMCFAVLGEVRVPLKVARWVCNPAAGGCGAHNEGDDQESVEELARDVAKLARCGTCGRTNRVHRARTATPDMLRQLGAMPPRRP